MTDDRPTQPTGSGAWIWRKPLERVVVDCAEFAQLEARLIVPPPEGDMTITVEELAA